MIFSKSSKETQKREEWKESSIERHDLYNFETKIDYKLERTNKKKTSYLLNTYIFLPETLQINQESYPKEQFFLDLNNRIRFKTPQMTIRGLLDKKNELSPINIILKKFMHIEHGTLTPKVKTRIEREIRLLACIVKVTLRDQFSYLFTEFDQLRIQGNIEDLIKHFLGSISDFQEEMSCLRDKFLMGQIPFNLREVFRFADEYISLQIQEWVTKALRFFEKKISPQLQKLMINIIEHEQNYRRNLNQRSVIERNTENEGFSYYEGILKKYVQGVLYLDKEKKDPKSSSLELLYSIAAGFAMFMSLFLGFLILSNYVENSIPFLIGVVVIYMLKDRIKDNIRSISEKAVGLVFPDKRDDIVDEFYQKKIGISKEKANFIKWEEIPPEILELRRSSSKSALEEEGKPENVIFYTQKISLLNRIIEEIHTRKKDLSNIIRFNIKEFLRYADDPIEKYTYWNPEEKRIETIPIAKVYHINVILKMSTFHDKKLETVKFRKFRVILDQDGIKRVEGPNITF
ncbi:MAG: hypothetical protein EU544_04135 [Promethearchaeota archaeon]|nr:MAG: hypothetical protein EU544_04135 [Candidatus Lokiarchaeota archaeon]